MSVTSIDEHERQMIRHSLARFKTERGNISIDEMNIEITFHKGLKQGTLPYKSLYRFMRGEWIENEDLIVDYRNFVRDHIKDFYEASIGPSLIRFFELGATDRDFAGEYILINTGGKTGKMIVTRDARHHYRMTAYHADHSIYDGVMVCGPKAVIIVARDRLTNLPKTYIIDPTQNPFAGATTATKPNGTGHYVENDKVELLHARPSQRATGADRGGGGDEPSPLGKTRTRA